MYYNVNYIWIILSKHNFKLPTTPGNYLKYIYRDGLSYMFSNEGFLNYISNLPPNKGVVLHMYPSTFAIRFKTDNNGILYFNEERTPLPLPLFSETSSIFLNFDDCDIVSKPLYSQYPKPIANFILSNEDIKALSQVPYTMNINIHIICRKKMFYKILL